MRLESGVIVVPYRWNWVSYDAVVVYDPLDPRTRGETFLIDADAINAGIELSALKTSTDSGKLLSPHLLARGYGGGKGYERFSIESEWVEVAYPEDMEPCS